MAFGLLDKEEEEERRRKKKGKGKGEVGSYGRHMGE